jgi:hypothetical protein
VILARQLLEGEFVVAADFPQEGRIEFGRLRLGASDQRRRIRTGEAQQHVGRLHLGTLAAGQFDLQ